MHPTKAYTFALLVSLVSGASAGCCYLPTGAGGGGSSSTSAPTPGQAEFDALGRGLRERATYDEGPGAREIARALRAHLEPRDGVAVRVVPGAPRRVVALVRFDDDAQEGLADMSSSRREDYLRDMLATLDEEMGTSLDDVGIGIRGNIVYGAVLTRRSGALPVIDTGTVVSTAPLAALCAPALVPSAP